MKKLILLLLLFFPAIVFGQKFYVSSMEKECEIPVADYLVKNNKDVTTKRDDADYIIECLLVPKGGGNYKGCLTIVDAKSGAEIARSKEIHKSVTSKDSLHLGKKIFEILADKHLAGLLAKIKK